MQIADHQCQYSFGIREGDKSGKYPKCWYEPLTTPEDITMGLRFTLSHPITAAVPPGEGELFKIALDVRNNLKPLRKSEVRAIKEKAMAGLPLFRYEGA